LIVWQSVGGDKPDGFTTTALPRSVPGRRSSGNLADTKSLLTCDQKSQKRRLKP
jgi:hypothetical protein